MLLVNSAIYRNNKYLHIYTHFNLSTCQKHFDTSYMSIYLSICFSIYLSTCLYVFLSIYLPDYLVYLFFYLSIYLSIFFLSIYLPVYLVYLFSIYLSTCLSSLSVFVSIYLSKTCQTLDISPMALPQVGQEYNPKQFILNIFIYIFTLKYKKRKEC